MLRRALPVVLAALVIAPAHAQTRAATPAKPAAQAAAPVYFPERLDWQTKKLLELEVARDGITLYVRPELVVEVAFNEVQASTQYPGGVALRFARIKRYRTDKTAAETDTIGTVQEIYRRLTGEMSS